MKIFDVFPTNCMNLYTELDSVFHQDILSQYVGSSHPANHLASIALRESCTGQDQLHQLEK